MIKWLWELCWWECSNFWGLDWQQVKGDDPHEKGYGGLQVGVGRGAKQIKYKYFLLRIF